MEWGRRKRNDEWRARVLLDKTLTVNKHAGKILSILMAGGILGTNIIAPYMGMSVLSFPVLKVAGITAGGFLIDFLHKENEYEKVFRLCEIVNKDNQVPLVIKKQKNGIKTTLVIHMPPGISQKKFEEKQQELEQCFNAKIEFGFNKNLIVDLIEMNLGTQYDYELEETKNPLEVLFGYSDEGKYYLNIEKSQHIIFGGATDSGKSTGLITIILSLILSKHKVVLHLVDFQNITLPIFEDCKKVKSCITTPQEFDKLLDNINKISAERLKLFRSVKNKVYVEKLQAWNQMFPERALPYIVIVIDEFAKLAEKEYEPIVEKFRTIASQVRKAGIHIILSIQRCSVDLLSGSTKNNFPTRISYRVASQTDSKVILDEAGAEKLKNQGRCLVMNFNGMKEVQTLFIEPKKIRGILKEHNKYKTTEDIEQERKQVIEDFRAKNINPYRKGLTN